jgi:predicted nucleotidyltransferase
MTVIYNHLSNPIDPAKSETLQRLYSVIGSMPVILLGAFARDLIFSHIHGIEDIPRATMDIDICVQMASWDDFNAACDHLKVLGFENKEEEHPEKFTDANGQEVDLLPFGGLSEDGRTITWPTDNSPWTISGIQEAHDHAILVELDGVELRVVQPCAMIYLKMFATRDRPGARKKKDSADIHYVLKHYLKVTGANRIRSEGSDADIMQMVGGNLQHAAARLAGRDMGRIVQPQTAEGLSEILQFETESHSECPIAHALARSHNGQFQTARNVLKALRDGFEESRPCCSQT